MDFTEALALIESHFDPETTHSRRLPLPASAVSSIRIALHHAEVLADDLFDSPAAVCFAFTQMPRAFAQCTLDASSHAAFLPVARLCEAQAQRSGLKLFVSQADIALWAAAVAAGSLNYEALRTQFAEVTRPYGG